MAENLNPHLESPSIPTSRRSNTIYSTLPPSPYYDITTDARRILSVYSESLGRAVVQGRRRKLAPRQLSEGLVVGLGRDPDWLWLSLGEIIAGVIWLESDVRNGVTRLPGAGTK